MAAALIGAFWLTACSAPPTPATPTGTDLPDKAVLERQKLAADVRSIETSTQATQDTSSWFIRLAPFLTVLVASGSLLLTVAKDRSATRDARHKEKAADAAEARKRHDEAIAATVQNMGADSARLRLNASAALAPVLQDPDDPRVASDLLPVVVANLRCEQDPNVIDMLVHDLGLALRQLAVHRALPADPDLTRAQLRRIRVPGLSLGRVDLAFSDAQNCDFTDCPDLSRTRAYGADLSGSRFSRSNLHEARLNRSICRRTHFHETKLVSATFKGADLTGAQFQRAQLQGAHFEGAVCDGATFAGADLADAWFCEFTFGKPAVLDESALLSISRARSWRAAHFIPEHRQRLEDLSVNGIT